MATATPADAQVILELYDLRREAEMRKARNFITGEFNPTSVEDVLAVVKGWGTDNNRYFRQVLSYWDMAASFYLRGAVDKELFLDNCGEMFFIYAKLEPYLQDLRTKLGNPGFCSKIEQVVTDTEAGRNRVKMVQQMIANMRAPAK